MIEEGNSKKFSAQTRVVSEATECFFYRIFLTKVFFFVSKTTTTTFAVHTGSPIITRDGIPPLAMEHLVYIILHQKTFKKHIEHWPT